MATDPPAGSGRPFLGVHFECCNVYARIYRTANGERYAGRCPKCMRAISFKVGEGGSGDRFWRVK